LTAHLRNAVEEMPKVTGTQKYTDFVAFGICHYSISQLRSQGLKPPAAVAGAVPQVPRI